MPSSAASFFIAASWMSRNRTGGCRPYVHETARCAKSRPVSTAPTDNGPVPAGSCTASIWADRRTSARWPFPWGFTDGVLLYASLEAPCRKNRPPTRFATSRRAQMRRNDPSRSLHAQPRLPGSCHRSSCQPWSLNQFKIPRASLISLADAPLWPSSSWYSYSWRMATSSVKVSVKVSLRVNLPSELHPL
jgi:hypothetical protein